MWFNPMMKWLIQSPLNILASKNTMTMTYTGRKSGKTYTTPMNYVHTNSVDRPILWTTSLRERTWWHNLRGGAPVRLHLKGKDVGAKAEAIEDIPGVVQGLGVYLQAAPAYARYLNVQLDPDGTPNPDDLTRAAEKMVVVRTQLA